jgi:hypothetical protein
MGLFGFIGEIASATVKVVATPLTITKDVIDIATGNEAENTSKLLDSVGNNIEKGFDKLTEDL